MFANESGKSQLKIISNLFDCWFPLTTAPSHSNETIKMYGDALPSASTRPDSGCARFESDYRMCKLLCQPSVDGDLYDEST